MPWLGSLVFCSVVVIVFTTSTAFGEVQIAQDFRHQVIGITGLSENWSSCSKGGFVGKVVKRFFADDAMTVTGFVVEMANGSRTFINVSVPENLDRFTQGAVLNGLQRLIKEGRRITATAQICGSGPVLTLEQIQ